MMDGAKTTKFNWQALQRLSVMFLAECRKQNPGWDYRDLLKHLNLPDTSLVRNLAEESGFKIDHDLSVNEENSILRLMVKGIRDPKKIAQQTHLPIRTVRDFVRKTRVPYGKGGYGCFPYPGSEDKDNALNLSNAQVRRISPKGQFSYQGKVYGLGAVHAGKVCLIEDIGEYLLVYLPGNQQIKLSKSNKTADTQSNQSSIVM